MRNTDGTSAALLDGTGCAPHYSLRSLCRALRESVRNRHGSVARCLFEGFRFSFLCQLERAHYDTVDALISKYILGNDTGSVIRWPPLPRPPPEPGCTWIQVEGYWLRAGELEPGSRQMGEERWKYVLTPAVCDNLRDLARVVSAGSLPVLLQVRS